MNFKPKLWKVIVSIIIIIIWYNYNIIIILSNCAAAGGVCLQCTYSGIPSLFPNCCGCGINLSLFTYQLLFILLPGILVYIIWSLFDKKTKINKESNTKKTIKKRRK